VGNDVRFLWATQTSAERNVSGMRRNWSCE
jgi:hypothetical protein